VSRPGQKYFSARRRMVWYRALRVWLFNSQPPTTSVRDQERVRSETTAVNEAHGMKTPSGIIVEVTGQMVVYRWPLSGAWKTVRVILNLPTPRVIAFVTFPGQVQGVPASLFVDEIESFVTDAQTRLSCLDQHKETTSEH
jgi:hypothetical protein